VDPPASCLIAWVSTSRTADDYKLGRASMEHLDVLQITIMEGTWSDRAVPVIVRSASILSG
jgi:hypothetical protein